MKKALFILILGLSAATAFSQQSPIASNSGNRIEVVFSGKLTLKDLMKIQSDLRKKNIELRYTRLEFTDEGKLQFIKFKVDCGDGFRGEASSGKLLNDTKFGFYRDYEHNQTDPFGTGRLQ